jgi:Ras-related protein Rab-11A
MNDLDDYDVIFKLVLIGDSGVGKSNILSRYLKDEFSIETKSTVGVEFGTQKIKMNNLEVKVQIWDTAGQERYRSITNAYYKGSKGALIVYDIAKQESFDNVDRWLSELRNHADSDVTVILIGNKCDMEADRRVSREAAQAKAEHYGIPFMETSAYRSVNIEKAFKTMLEGKLFLN